MSAFSKNIYSFSLDIKRKTGTRVLSVEGDTANQFIVFLTDDGKPLDLTGLYVRAVFRRSDGRTILQSESDEDGPVTKVAASGKVIINVKNGSYRDGDNYMEIQILDTDPDSGDILSTTAQMLIRARNCLLTDEATTSSVEFPILQSLIDALRNMEVHVTTLPSTSDATGTIELEDGIFVLYLGIPRGVGIANITLSNGILTFTLDDDTTFSFDIGATVFVATYNVTSGAEIYAAHAAGKVCVVREDTTSNPRYGFLYMVNEAGAAVFYAADPYGIKTLGVAGTTWTKRTVYTGTFIATYGETQYSAIYAAYTHDMPVYCERSGRLYSLVRCNGSASAGTFLFASDELDAANIVMCLHSGSSSVWTYGTMTLQKQLIAGDGITITSNGSSTNEETGAITYLGATISADPMVGATSGANGSAGMVPAPLIADKDKYLCGDGTWKAVQGGGSSESVLIAEYDVTSFGAITAAITAGKAVFVHWTASSKDYYAGYAYQDDDEVQFIHVKTTTGRVETTRITCYDLDGDTSWEKQVNCSQNWLAAGTGIEIAAPTSSMSGEDTTLIGTSEISAKAMVGATSQANGSAGIVPAPLVADREKYLRGDGTWQTVQSGSNDVFVAVYGTTSYADIKAASDAGKAVFAFRAADSVAAPLTNIHTTSSTSDLSFEFTHNWTIHKYVCFYSNGSTTWSNSSTMLMRKGFGHGVCSTAAATAAKTVSIDDYVACDGAIIAVRFTYGVPESATLSVNNAAASAIYHNGAAIGANIINAGDTATLMYKATGGIYHLIAIDRNAQDKANEVTVSTAGAVSQVCADNTVYTFTGALTSLTLTEASGAREYLVIFTTGSTAPTVTFPSGVVFPDTLTIEANTRYEISVRDGYAVAQSWAVS